jgi:TetR/AcrR family transcriptional regulator, mexJK operon transcriptional repressor
MKTWAPDHPKAKLMARKRSAILDAARDAFLKLGYEGTSMEAIAEAAGVSIMTLYRHAESKDDLFAAVIANACDPDDEEERAEFEKLLKKPLGEVLVSVGIFAQQRLADPATVALLRAVMAETSRFPELAQTAYRGFVVNLEDMVERVLADKDESRALGKPARRKLAALFIDRLFGADMLRVLLGLGGASVAEQKQRAERARDEVMAGI